MVSGKLHQYHPNMATRQQHQNGKQKQQASVWLVEDNDTFRSSILELLNSSESLRCERASSTCEEALRWLGEGEVPEVVLMDIKLPGMDGIEGVRQFKTASPSTSVIMLTIYDDDDKVFHAICAGANGYLLKKQLAGHGIEDAGGDSIVAAIHDVLGGGAPMNAHIARRVLEMFAKFSVPRNEYGLSAREKEILQRLVEGLTMKQIAEKLFLSYYTIDTHLKNIYAKLQVHSRSSAVAKALKENLL